RQQFSDQGIWWQWTVAPAPLAATGITAATANTVAATTHPAASGVIGSADLSDPAMTASCALSWTQLAGAVVVFEGYSGVKLVASQQASMATAGSNTLRLS